MSDIEKKLKQARRTIRNDGLALKLKRLSINHIAKCGCCYDLYDHITKSGIILEGGKVCKMIEPHPFVYQPSAAFVMNEGAIKMFKTYIGVI